MIRFAFIGLALCFLGGTAHAQTADLFPELQGKFQQPATTKPATVNELDSADLFQAPDTPAVKPAAKSPAIPTKAEPVIPTAEQDETGENNLKVEIQNINATLTLARNFSYGKADIVVKNETNQQLNLLVIDLTYGETTTQITFSNVPKKQEQTQAFMMIGPDCDYMDTLPKMEVKTCKLGKLSDEACKNRVQLTPLQ